MSNYIVRYEGTRWRIYYGKYDGVEQFAVNELQKIVQRHFPYIIEVQEAANMQPDTDTNAIIVGTPADNKQIAYLIEEGLLAAPSLPEEYSIACMDSPWSKGQRLLVIAGSDANGIIYGINDLDTRILTKPVPHGAKFDARKAFDEIADFSIKESPAIQNRGIWTWGYVIYDYRRFIDNMARCKMNMITIWNDCPPLNIREVIDYAHSRGIRVILGYHWGWGMDIDPTSREDLEKIKADVLSNHYANYSALGMDGIYFQLGFTESSRTQVGGKSIAELSCEWVNEIAGEILKEEPDLLIQFGLHATSVLDCFGDLQDLNPKIEIVWEDAGAIPYYYSPIDSYDDEGDAKAKGLGSVDATLDYSKRLASLRGAKSFAMVPKGWTCLSWSQEFEHHNSFILGERDPGFIKHRLALRKSDWNSQNALWFHNYPFAARFYREILKCVDGPITATGLVEDGDFEETIQPSVALFAEMLWDPSKMDDELMEYALSAHYSGDYAR